jgi:DNA-directed RNA polymerase subunit L
MEIKKIEESKTKFVFEIIGVSHGFCNMLKEELQKDNHIKTATYRVEHPLINIPKFLVETDGNELPKDALKKAIKSLKSFTDKTKKDLTKSLK